MKIKKSVEVEVSLDIPWKFARFGSYTYMAVCGDQLVMLRDDSIFLNSNVNDVFINDATVCEKSEFNAALDALIKKLTTLRETGEL